MRLEKFTKNKKQKKIMISAIVGLILLVGGITLYRTFALYEEKKEFNVLKGKVPNFGDYDIKLAFTIDGESKKGVSFPNKEDGYTVDSVTCKNGVTAEWNFNLWGLVNIKNTNNEKIECTINFASGSILAKIAEVGDYVSYTPVNSSYTIPTDLTGYTYSQPINPSELSLWRIININEEEGTIDIVSEYASSTLVHFSGKTGYERMVGSLNTIAKQYETEGITSGSRHIGYNGQTGTVTVNSMAIPPWTESITSTNSPNGSAREKAGGGDVGYEIDYNLVKTALGTVVANKPNTTTASNYWLASRFYYYGNPTTFNYNGRYVNNIGVISEANNYYSYRSGWSENYDYHAIRPIVTLRKGLPASEGTLDGKKTWVIN